MLQHGVKPETKPGFSPERKNIMAFVKIWVHAVWGTKNRKPALSKEIRTKLFYHIRDNAKDKMIYIDSINGYSDHVHCLLALNADISISKVIQLLKGESSYWINKNNLIKPKLEWADEYFAVSVSESVVNKTRIYIKRQEEHHHTATFAQEYEKFIKMYRFSGQG